MATPAQALVAGGSLVEELALLDDNLGRVGKHTQAQAIVSRPGVQPAGARRVALVRGLQRLGYGGALLRQWKTSEQIAGGTDALLDKAVKAFQRGAGLEADGQAGVLTWEALTQLTDPEATLQLDSWTDQAGGPRDALQRAVHDQLLLLGQLRTRVPVGGNSRWQAQLRRFEALVRLTGLAPSLGLVTASSSWPVLARALLDHDGMVRGLGSMDWPKIYPGGEVAQTQVSLRRKPERYDQDRGPDEPWPERFVVRVVRRELLLQGFDTGSIRFRRNDSLRVVRGALRAFWRTAEDEGTATQGNRLALTRNTLADLELAGEAGAMHAAHLEEVGVVLVEQMRGRKDLRRAMGSRLREGGHARGGFWQGLHRGLHYLGHLLRQTVGTLVQRTKAFVGTLAEALSDGLEWAKAALHSVARFLVRGASAALTAGRRAWESLVDFLDGPELVAGDPAAPDDLAVACLRPDGDAVVVLGRGETDPALTELLARFERRGRVRDLAFAIIPVVLRVIRAALTGLGWLAVLFRLVKDIRSIKQAVEALMALPRLART